MAEKKTTQKKTTQKKATSTTRRAKKIKLTFQPVAAGTKVFNLRLTAPGVANINGKDVATTVPLIEGLPMKMSVKKGEVIEVTEAQYQALEEYGFVESEEEYKARIAFVDNLDPQHPDTLNFDQTGSYQGLLTATDSQHKVYMDKLIRV